MCAGGGLSVPKEPPSVTQHTNHTSLLLVCGKEQADEARSPTKMKLLYLLLTLPAAVTAFTVGTI